MTIKTLQNGGLTISAGSELEQWRAATLLEKEPETIAWLDRCADRGGILWDIGANVGLYGLYAAARNPALEVYAFEPVRQNYVALVDNVRLNNLRNMRHFHVALGSKDGLAQLYLPDERVGNSGAQVDQPVDERGHSFEPKDVQTVIVHSIASLVKNYGLPVPNYIKLDVDGHEAHILAGMGELIASPGLQSVLVEFNSLNNVEAQLRTFGAAGLMPDGYFNDFPQHSRKRREATGGVAMNYVFSRW